MDQSRWWKAQHRESNQWIIIALFGDTWCCTWGEHNTTYRVVHSIVHLKLMSRGESVILQWKNGDYKRTQAPMPFPSVSPDPFFRLTLLFRFLPPPNMNCLGFGRLQPQCGGRETKKIKIPSSPSYPGKCEVTTEIFSRAQAAGSMALISSVLDLKWELRGFFPHPWLLLAPKAAV